MTQYKTIRVTNPVYDQIAMHQYPRESISETILRLMTERKYLYDQATAMLSGLRQEVTTRLKTTKGVENEVSQVPR